MKIRFIAVALIGMLAGFALAGDSADVMLGKINAVKNPTFDAKKRTEAGYMDQYYSEVGKANEERAKLILEFYKAYPDNAENEKLMNQRWASLAGVKSPPAKQAIDGALADIESILAANPPAKIKQAGSFWKARYGLISAGKDLTKVAPIVDAFTKAYPADERGAQLLQSEAALVTDNTAKRAIFARLAKDYKDSIPGKYAPGILRQMDAIGKPFDLDFKDAISGKQISMKDLKGKVVLIDFWATWCGPCIAKMPEMKQLYADLHAKGFEVVGVSLDQDESKGGLTKLRDYVDKNQVAWPQYYQGNYWDSEFSKSWGINSIPCVFLVDKNGNLAEITYPDKLDEKIKKLLGS